MSKNNRNQNHQYRVFIQKNGGYLEISYEEFCRTKDTIFKGTRFISSCGILMEVSNEFYAEYYRDLRHEKYLRERSVEKEVYYHSLDTDEFSGEEILVDPDENVAEQVTDKLMREYIRNLVYSSLPSEESELIEALFFRGLTEREYADEKNVSQVAIHKRKIRILAKLKKIFENLSI